MFEVLFRPPHEWNKVSSKEPSKFATHLHSQVSKLPSDNLERQGVEWEATSCCIQRKELTLIQVKFVPRNTTKSLEYR